MPERIDLDRSIDFTVDWGDSYAHHGTMLNHYEVSHFQPKGKATDPEEEWQSFRVHLSPHSVTHMDLPWALRGAEPKYGTRDAQEVRMGVYTRTQALDAIVLDFRDRQHVLEEALQDSLRFEETEPVRLLEDSKLMELLNRLRIDRKDILDTVEQGAQLSTGAERLLENRFLVFHTGWRQRFGRGWHDLGDPGWELLHPYLMHPFIEADTAKWLVDGISVRGVGVDCSNLECPLYNVDPMTTPRYERIRTKYWEAAGLRGDLHEPGHSALLNNTRLLVESLAVPASEQMDELYGDRQYALGRLWLFPLHVRNVPDCCLVKILFEPGTDHGRR